MKKKLHVLIAMVLIVAMAVSMAGCGGKKTKSSGSSKGNKKEAKNIPTYSDGWGTEGELEWYFHGDTGVLEISGEGSMVNPDSYQGTGTYKWESYQDGVKEILINEGVVDITKDAFGGCSNCTKLTLPSTLKRIDQYAFAHLAITEITLPSNVEEMGTGIFSHCADLEQVTIETEEVPGWTFDGCGNLRSVTLSDNVKYIGIDAFQWCALESINLPSGVKKIDNEAFRHNNSLKHVVVPDTVEELGGDVFSVCDHLLTAEFNAPINVPGGIFSHCDRLRVVKLGPKVTGMDYFAILGAKLDGIYMPENVSDVNESAMYSGKVTIYAPKKSAGWELAGANSDFQYVDTATAEGQAEWEKLWSEAIAE